MEPKQVSCARGRSMRCPNCQQENLPEAEFCLQGGTRLESNPPENPFPSESPVVLAG